MTPLCCIGIRTHACTRALMNFTSASLTANDGDDDDGGGMRRSLGGCVCSCTRVLVASYIGVIPDRQFILRSHLQSDAVFQHRHKTETPPAI